jgi:Dolichyl-phosphate-mannose-protein mannosyltransferase
MQEQSFGWREVILAVILFAIAAGTRAGYLLTCLDDWQQPPPFAVQDAQTAITIDRGDNAADGKATVRDELVENTAKYNWYGSHAPFAIGEEVTAYISPGYPSLLGYLERLVPDAGTRAQIVLWTQCALGGLTAVFYFFFARLAFGNAFVGVLAGLLAALHPFWIVNVAEFQDGTLASFLLAACLFLGAAGLRGSPLASLLFGGSLAGLSLVRAALLPFGFIACIWFLLGCRKMHRGWLCAILAFLGFANGLAPWTVRNYQVFRTAVPVTDSMYVHLWAGNNSRANGGPQDGKTMLQSLSDERMEALLTERNQVARYRMLAEDVGNSVANDPAGTFDKRLRSGVSFVFGSNWLHGSKQYGSRLWRENIKPDDETNAPDWIIGSMPALLTGTLLFMLILGLIGWRWSCGWSRDAGIASLALLWIPLPYILSHAEYFSGPRLPLDGVLLCYSAFVLAWIVPGGARFLQKPEGGW